MWDIPSQRRLDVIPRLYETEGLPLKNKFIYLHFSIFDCNWYITEYKDGLFFGYVILNGAPFAAAFWKNTL
jgi:hypothetical protein